MARPVGQVTGRQALAGLLAVVGGVVGLVIGLEWLLLPVQEVPPLEAPASDGGAAPGPGDGCPAGPPADADLGPVRVTSSLLIDCPDTYDGVAVVYDGEVVGEVLQRDDRAWVQLNDDPYALTAGPLPAHRTTLGGNSGLAVSVPAQVVPQIAVVGGYERQGTVLSVVGEFRRTDPADGGGLTIQANQVAVLDEGRIVRQSLATRRLVAAAVLSAVTVALAGVVLRARRA